MFGFRCRRCCGASSSAIDSAIVDIAIYVAICVVVAVAAGSGASAQLRSSNPMSASESAGFFGSAIINCCPL